MKKILIALVIFVSLTACNKNKFFHVEGTVKEANGETLYLDRQELTKTYVIDSVKLREDGKFSLKGARPKYPDFYRLRIKNKTITFSVDSSETITIETNLPRFSTDYEIQGSYQSEKIKQLRLSIINIQNKINLLQKENSQTEKTRMAEEIEKDIETHKDMARKLILENTSSTTAYFALYQKINDRYIFSPYNKEDAAYWRAVATGYNAFMPGYNRTTNLYNLTLDAMKQEKLAEQREAEKEVMAELMQYAKGYIDINLPDVNGQKRQLAELEGKVVLIDFSAYQATESVDYVFNLRELYNKYHKRGFEIYQISLDRNKLLWEVSVENLPWICVHDEDGFYAKQYNVARIPTLFLMNKEGKIVARDMKFSELDREIGKLLK